jgi:predicted TIM-barrel fold metal-dependent hydrolase
MRDDPDTPSPGCPPPHPYPRTPSILLPPGSCDSHCHVFGPGNLFPYAKDRTFTPVDVPRQKVAQLHRFLGFGRAVIVQSSCNGTDHAVLLDALAAGAGLLRGVALIDERTTADEIARLHEAGVRGVRLNFLPHLRRPPDRAEVAAVLGKVTDRGWHAEIHVAGSGVLEYGDLIRGIEAPVVIDHLGRVDLAGGLEGPSVRALKALLDTGNVWVKVSGVDRVSRTGPPYADAVELGAMLVRHAPDRVLWGTDYPHPNIVGDAPDDGLLTDLLGDLAPTSDLLERLLVTNPTKFFDF